MPKKLITLRIDDHVLQVPEGMLVVDAAKKVDVDIPVFCYHPKMEPVGMCRMCLVEIGRPVIDRTTGEVVKEADGSPRIAFGPKLDTACTTPVSEGMLVRTTSPAVIEARKGMLEFILTSHPLDCPVCDKGGECPLQNLTLRHGPGTSRFIFDEKMHLAKRVPLGELIWLDRERCIQCGRCVRFQHEVVDDPAIDFYQRGRSLEIITRSELGFDSIFSGNTTDICPVGALTTADFRFGARPWEMVSSASVCSHCPVGCNITYNVRREAKSGGGMVIKRVMPRQNEAVNEIWMCDKGRLGYHFTESPERLREPLVRRNGELVPVGWDEALDLAAQKLREAGSQGMVLAGGRLSNEDLFNLRKLAEAAGGQTLLDGSMGGGDLAMKLGPGSGTNLGDLGAGSAILVVASDLHQEAPLWWLRIKQAAERGATLIVVNPNETRLDEYATFKMHYNPGELLLTFGGFLESEAGRAFAAAENGLIFYGGNGLGLQQSTYVARAAAELLVKTGHYGKANNGLVPVWPKANDQGAWEMGFRPVLDLNEKLRQAKVAYIAASDPAGDDPRLAAALDEAGFVIVQELFMTETARRADVVLPAAAYTEREGTFTNGMRRVQRYYPAATARGSARPDFALAAQIADRLGLELPAAAPTLVMERMAGEVPDFAGLTYQKLAEVQEQWPIVGRGDMYYGGTGYENRQGLGVQLSSAAERGEKLELPDAANPVLPAVSNGSLLVIPVTRLYDQGTTLRPTTLLAGRMSRAELGLHPETAAKLGLQPEGEVWLSGEGWRVK
ncbi:NADH-quinone oxidoreductase, chain G, partial [Longilinea arvoryzae]